MNYINSVPSNRKDFLDETFTSLNYQLNFDNSSQSYNVSNNSLTNITITRPNTSTETIYSYQIGDFNGDKIPEILVLKGSYTYVQYIGFTSTSSPDLTNANSVYSIDHNNDGKTDLFKLVGENYSIYEYNISTSSWNLTANNISGLVDRANFPQSQFSLFPADVNGDGKMDICGFYNGITYNGSACLSTGKSFTRPNPFFTPDEGTLFDENGKYSLPGDFNSDGMLDFMSVRKYGDMNRSFTFRFSRWESVVGMDGSNTVVPLNLNILEPANYLVGDFDGNGSQDILCIPDGGAPAGSDAGKPLIILIGKSETSKVVTSITDGLGRTSSIEYDYLRHKNGSEDDFYMNGSPCTYPLVNYKSTLLAVKSINVPDGIGGIMSNTYKFRGAKLHVQGKGFLGFDKVIMENTITGVKTETEYQLFDYHTFPVHSTTYIKGSLVAETYTTPKLFKYSIPFIYFPAILSTQSLKQDGENVINVTETFNTYNTPYGNNGTYGPDYGEIKKVETKIGPGYGVVEGTETHEYQYQSFGNIRRVTQEDVSTQFLTGTKWTRTEMTYQYDAGGKLLSSKKFPGSKYEVLNEIKNRDAFGNALQIRISLPNEVPAVAARTTNYTYEPKGRFVLSTINPLGQTISMTTDPVTGKVLKSVAINGKETIWEYDPLYRIKTVTFPRNITKKYTYGWSSDLSKGLYFTSVESPGQPNKTEYYDLLGRTIRTEIQQWGGKMITTTVYDSQGRVASNSLPAINNPGTDLTSYTYDDMGRVLTESFKGKITTYTHAGLTVTGTGPDGKKNTSVNYTYGKLRKVIDNNGKEINYTYHGCGEPESITAIDKVTSMTYEYRFRTQLININAGIINYTFNGFGELVAQKDAKGNILTTTYDVLGRVTNRTGANNISINYFPAGNGIGRVSSVSNGINTKTYIYDEWGNIDTETETIKSQTFTSRYTYDELNRPKDVGYPSGCKATYSYDDTKGGYVKAINWTDEKQNTTTVWTINNVNEREQPVQYTYGNGMVVNYEYDPFYNLKEIKGTVGSNILYRYGITVNPDNGNVSPREDKVTGKSESFGYDNLDRLNKITYGSTVENISYYDNGRINVKDNIGTYTYDNSTHPDAVTKVSSGNGFPSFRVADITYNELNLVATLSQQGYKYDFTYGVSDERILMNLTLPSGNIRSTYYLGSYEKVQETQPSKSKELHYISSPYGLIGAYIIENGLGKLYYANTDHQGSLMMLTDNNGNIVEKFSYDAWGRRRNPNDWNDYNVITSGLLTRGFLMQEHLDEIGLINLNARIYDPSLGVFLSPDPVIGDMTDIQNYNGYSYALNNPLKYSDPNGDCPVCIAIGVGALLGAIVNVASNAGSIHNFGDFLSYAGIGALAGGIAGAAAFAAAPVLFVQGGTMGMSAGAVVELGMASGFAGGLTNGFITGFGNGFKSTGDFWGGFQSAVMGGISGAAMGMATGGLTAYLRFRPTEAEKKLYRDLQQKANKLLIKKDPVDDPEAFIKEYLNELYEEAGKPVISREIPSGWKQSWDKRFYQYDEEGKQVVIEALTRGIETNQPNIATIYFSKHALKNARHFYIIATHELVHGRQYFTGLGNLPTFVLEREAYKAGYEAALRVRYMVDYYEELYKPYK